MTTPFPPLDLHAHVAPDVTHAQLQRLGDATIFAVTRSLEEASAVVARTDDHLIWGCGVHPGVRAARNDFDPNQLRKLLARFTFVGEVGLDRRAGSVADQTRIFESVLDTIRDRPVLVSVHSAGITGAVADLVAAARHPGVILHWFLGSAAEIHQATEAGCYFSINGAMTDDVIRRLPIDRLLPETDYPSTARKGGGRRPGDITSLEQRLALLFDEPTETIRWRWYRNLRTLTLASDTLDRLPRNLATQLLHA